MPACAIDYKASPHFARSLKDLKRRFPHVDQDLADIFPDIERDYETAAKARKVPGLSGLGGSVWKYDAASSDQQKGGKGGFRMIAFHPNGSGKLYPLFVYAKNTTSDLPRDDVRKAIQVLKSALAPPPSPIR